MKKIYTIILGIILTGLLAINANAQTISSTTYLFSNLTGATLTDMTSGTTQLVGPNIDDGASAVTNIGFNFYFAGTLYTQFSANANGLVR